MTKRKILTDDGKLLGYFDDYEELAKSGNIILYGASSEEGTRSRSEQIDRPLIRKAFKLEQKKTRYGLMCTNCHQASLMEVIDKENGNYMLKQDSEGNGYFVLDSKPSDIIKALDNAESAFEFIQKIDTNDNIGKKRVNSLSALSKDYIGTNPDIACYQCDNQEPAQKWVNEYHSPTSPNHIVCPICGESMTIINSTETTDEHKAICDNEKCKFESITKIITNDV